MNFSISRKVHTFHYILNKLILWILHSTNSITHATKYEILRLIPFTFTFTMVPLKHFFYRLCDCWMFLQKSFFTLLISHCFYILALRDNRIELVRASWKELTISISDVTLSDEGQYTCSLFTMPVKTSKAFLTVLGKTSHRFLSLTSSSICTFTVNTFTSDLGSVCSLPSHDLVFFLPFGNTKSVYTGWWIH